MKSTPTCAIQKTRASKNLAGTLVAPRQGPRRTNTSPDMIANFEEPAECQGHAITASVAADGRFTMTNMRNGFSKSYTARRAELIM